MRYHLDKLKKHLWFYLFFIAILLSGFFYRLYLSAFAVKGLFWDMADYDYFAREMLSGKLITDCCHRNVGYSAFLALIYLIFGQSNLAAVRFMNILLELCSAVLIFFSAKKMFGRKTAFVSLILFVSNPFTAAYTGLILPESITVFYISLIVFVLSRDRFIRSRRLWVFFGFLTGLLLFTRSQFYYFSFLLPLVFSLLLYRELKRLFFILLFLTGFLISSFYTLLGNYRNFQKISLIPPYNSGIGILYANFYVGKYPDLDIRSLNPEYARIFEEYEKTPLLERSNFYDKYKRLYFEKVKNEWLSYLSIIGSNIFWLWDKDHLFTYADPFHPKDSPYLRIYNLILLGFFAVGTAFFIRKKGKKNLKTPLVVFTIVLFLYITFFIALLSSESRHTLPFYPFIFFWGGYGVSAIYHLFYDKLQK